MTDPSTAWPTMRRPTGRRAPPRARGHLPPPVARRVHPPRRGPARPVPARPRRHPRLRLAVLAARPGSTHGYDVIDHGQPQPGGRHGGRLRARWSPPCRDRGMGLILDAVPEPHVRRRGRTRGGGTCWSTARRRRSPGYFDIAWDDSPAARHARPGAAADPRRRRTGQVLEAGELQLDVRRRGRSSSGTTSRRLPVDPRTYGLVLGPGPRRGPRRTRPGRRRTRRAAEHPDRGQHLPPRTETDPERVGEAAGRGGGHQAAAGGPAASGTRPSPGASPTAVDGAGRHARRPGQLRRARRAARRPGVPAVLLAGGVGRDQLPPVLRRQRPGGPEHRAGGGVPGGPPQAASGGSAAGAADGLRIDHPDGLFDPKQYLDRLQSSTSAGGRPAPARRREPDDYPRPRPGRRPRGRCAERFAEAAGPAAVRRRREDPRRRRAAAGRLGDATARPGTSSSTPSTACSWTRPARRPLTRALPAFTGLDDPFAGGGVPSRSC